MEYKINQGAKQHLNAARLICKAAKLEMNLDSYGFLDYNERSGNTYLWLEAYNFTLYISDFNNQIKALYTCPYDGEEIERNAGTSLEKLEAWVQRLAKKSEKKEGVLK
jgi:hypothetical protein